MRPIRLIATIDRVEDPIVLAVNRADVGTLMTHPQFRQSGPSANLPAMIGTLHGIPVVIKSPRA